MLRVRLVIGNRSLNGAGEWFILCCFTLSYHSILRPEQRLHHRRRSSVRPQPRCATAGGIGAPARFVRSGGTPGVHWPASDYWRGPGDAAQDHPRVVEPGPCGGLAGQAEFSEWCQRPSDWGKGITAASGVPNEQDQVLAFKVRPQFTAEFHCERQSRRAACLPITPMRLRFSAPIAWEQAR
jgi:hypothetical protein